MLDLDLESFSEIHEELVAEDAREHLARYSTAALAFGGDKKTIKKHLGPYEQILKDRQRKSDPSPGKNDQDAFLRRFGGGF